VNKNDLILELITDYINPGLAVHSGSIEIVSYHLTNTPPCLKVSFKGMCGECPSSFDQTLTTVTNFLREESEIPDLIIENTNEKPKNFNMKYAYNPDEE